MLDIIDNDSFDYDSEKVNFERTFSLLDHALSEFSFKRFNPAKDKVEGKFLLSAF
ncbi:MAG: hypothetical protein ACJA2S_001959 [Cyclobacteriaceae bacterium]|jgi:hypothetical protein